nr:MAG TPA: hypothetical protein [Caudoviricetes sp.]
MKSLKLHNVSSVKQSFGCFLPWCGSMLCGFRHS